jgi:hypothetical protein
MTPSYGVATTSRPGQRRNSTRRGNRPIELTPGSTIGAAAALTSGQRTYDAAQVAYLIALAYDSGRTASLREDLAEIHCTWEDHQEPRRSYEQVVAARLAEMAAGAKRAAKDPHQVLVRLTCDWPPLAKVGAVPMAEILRLRTAVFICPCERRTESAAYEGYHRTPGAFPKRWEQDRDARSAA